MKDILDKLDKIVLTEGQLGELASKCEADHEVQMARADLFKIAKYAIKLHDMMKNVSEADGIEGWKQSKITKAADYIGSVYHSLDYEMSPMADEAPAEAEQMDQMAFDLATEDKTDEGIKIVPKVLPSPFSNPKADMKSGMPEPIRKPKSKPDIGMTADKTDNPANDPNFQSALDQSDAETNKQLKAQGIGIKKTVKPIGGQSSGGKPIVKNSKTESDLGRETRKFSDWGKK